MVKWSFEDLIDNFSPNCAIDFIYINLRASFYTVDWENANYFEGGIQFTNTPSFVHQQDTIIRAGAINVYSHKLIVNTNNPNCFASSSVTH